jgi:hypothetical protein
MAGSVARLMILAAVVLFAGCGGGSSKKTVGTRSPGAIGPGPAIAAHRGFSTVIPPGYVPEGVGSSGEYLVTGPRGFGLTTTLFIFRQPPQEGDINTLARTTLRAARRDPRAQVLPPRSLSVDGERALAVGYVVKPRSTEKNRLAQHVRLVFVRHGDWVYQIRDFASPALYPAAAGALDEVIRDWHWL